MLADLVLETTNSPGSAATITLLGAAAGRRSFNAGFGVGPTFFYVMSDGTNLEWGIGSLSSSTSLNRSSVIGNSAGTTARLVFTGLTNIYNNLPSVKAVYRDTNGRVQMASQRIEGLAASAGADHAVRQDQIVLASGGAFTGAITATSVGVDANAALTLSSGNPVLGFDANDYLVYDRTGNTLSVVVGAAARFYVNTTDVVAQLPLSLTVGASSAAHATRKDYVDAAVAPKFPTAGGTITGSVQINGSNTVIGSIVCTGSIQVYNSASTNTGLLYLNASANRYLAFDGSNYIMPGSQLYVAGGQVWHSNNFSPGSYMPVSGGTFSGAIAAPGVSSSGDVSASGRLYGNSPRGGGYGYSIVDNTARFGPWSWYDGSGGYIGVDVDGASRGITVFSSDERLKDGITPALDAVLPDLRQIAFIDYRYKVLPQAPADTDRPLQRGGVSAQQLQTIRPEWVTVMQDEQKTLLPNVQLLLTTTMKALQELDAEVQALKAEVAALKATP